MSNNAPGSLVVDLSKPERKKPASKVEPTKGSANPIGLKGKVGIISRREDIPYNHGVLSCAGGMFELTEDLQKRYAVLLCNKESKDVEVVCSTEVASRGIDHDLLTINERIRQAGYVRTKKLVALPEMLAIIYESTETERSKEEKERTSTKIQIDFDNLVSQCVRDGVSDIHIEVRRETARVRVRKNGDMSEMVQWPVKYARNLCGVTYQVIAAVKDTTFDENKPQDAIIDRELGDVGPIRIRLATIPAYPSGFDMIMRILKMGSSGGAKSLESLGYSKPLLTRFRRAVAKPVGAVILAGTTGSGKSTSLNAAMSEKIRESNGRIKVITVEDPPEYLLENATQVPVVRSRGQSGGGAPSNPFAAVVRAAMRSDPDILMVGEVRDHDSAELLIHAVQSGHQVFSTIHASSALDIPARMRSNGVKDDILGSPNFFSALMYQTLLPTLCPHCSRSIQDFAKTVETEGEYELLTRIFTYFRSSDAARLRFRNEAGCPNCVKGVIGRSVASEIILPDAFMLQCFSRREDSAALVHYRHRGGKLAIDHGLTNAFLGKCDIRDVEHKLDRLTSIEEMRYSVFTQLNKNPKAVYQPSLILPEELAEGGLEQATDESAKRREFMSNFNAYLAGEAPCGLEQEQAAAAQSSSAPDLSAVEHKPAQPDPKPIPVVEPSVSTPTSQEPSRAKTEKPTPTTVPAVQEVAQPAPAPAPAPDFTEPDHDDYAEVEEPAPEVPAEPSEYLEETSVTEAEVDDYAEVEEDYAIDDGVNGSESAEAMSQVEYSGDDPVIQQPAKVPDPEPEPATEEKPVKGGLFSMKFASKALQEAKESVTSAVHRPETQADDSTEGEDDGQGVGVKPKIGFGLGSLKNVISKANDATSDPEAGVSQEAEVEPLSEQGSEPKKSFGLSGIKNVISKAGESLNPGVEKAQSIMPGSHSTQSTGDDSLDDMVAILVNHIADALRPELERNGLRLTERFLKARSSRPAIEALIGNEEIDESIREDIQRLSGDEDVMAVIVSMSAPELFGLVGKAPAPDSEETDPQSGAKSSIAGQFKSRLLGGEKTEKQLAEVTDLSSVRNKREEDGGSDDF